MNATLRTLLVCITALVSGAPAQSLSATAFVQGQLASLSTQGVAPGAPLFYGVSLAGLGSGSCYPGLCLDLLEPVALLTQGVADASGQHQWQILLPQGTPLISAAFQVVTIDASGPLPVLLKTNPLSISVVPLGSLDDEFGGAALDPSWSILHPGLAQISVSAGALHIEPTSSGSGSIWYQDSEGPLVYKEVSGDFVITVIMSVRALNNPLLAPPPQYRLGGLIARDPASSPGARNSVHIALGAGDNQTPLAVEDKRTISSTSSFSLTAVPDTAGEIRMTRAGMHFEYFYRPSGSDPWQLLAGDDRPDLPLTLHVGLMAYSASAPPNLRASFDAIHFAN